MAFDKKVDCCKFKMFLVFRDIYTKYVVEMTFNKKVNCCKLLQVLLYTAYSILKLVSIQVS